MNLYKKMAEIMKNVQYLSKDDTVQYKEVKYKGLSEEKITKTIREQMINVGIVVFPIEQTVTKNGNITCVNVKYQMVNIDDPDDYCVIASSGEGYDTQDKGAGKAMTYAYKYMLLRTFAIPTGEDPDKISSAEIDDIEKARKADEELKSKFIDDLKIIALTSEMRKRGVSEEQVLKGCQCDSMDKITLEAFNRCWKWLEKQPIKEN